MKVHYTVRIALDDDIGFANQIVKQIAEEARNEHNGICVRSAEFIEEKIRMGNAIIAVTDQNKWLGFCYNELWEDGYVSTCALIVNARFRMGNVARQLKMKAFEHAKVRFPGKIYFGLTTSPAVMKINSELGYMPVTYNEVTRDEKFWDSCISCLNFSILKERQKGNCLCTAMIYKSKKE